MPLPLAQSAADHKFLIEAAGRAAGLTDPVAFDGSIYCYYLLRKAVRGPLVPIDGVLVRAWETGSRLFSAGTHFGVRLYTVAGIRFAHVVASLDRNTEPHISSFHVVSRADYLRLFRTALRAMREREVASQPPVMKADQIDTLRRNTLGYLDAKNLKRIKDLGGRPKRGLLLTGPPGNGKTTACRWLWQECLRHGTRAPRCRR
jgi:SpoVK/Ycf46/Vps4 family AAA+-type ATPase